MITDTTTAAQRHILRTIEQYAAIHPISVAERIESTGAVSAHVMAGDPRVEYAAVVELADQLGLETRVALNGRFAAFHLPGIDDGLHGFAQTESRPVRPGDAVVWFGASPTPPPCPFCGTAPCTCVNPKPDPKPGKAVVR